MFERNSTLEVPGDDLRGSQSPDSQDDELPDPEVPRQVPPLLPRPRPVHRPLLRVLPPQGQVHAGQLRPRIVSVRTLLPPGQPSPYVGRIGPLHLGPRLLPTALPRPSPAHSRPSAPPPPGPGPPVAGFRHPAVLDLHEDEDRAKELGGLGGNDTLVMEEDEEVVAEEVEGDTEEAEGEDEGVQEELDDIVPPLSPCSAKRGSNHYQAEMFFHERRAFLRR